jgi:hypothetical protein
MFADKPISELVQSVPENITLNGDDIAQPAPETRRANIDSRDTALIYCYGGDECYDFKRSQLREGDFDALHDR